MKDWKSLGIVMHLAFVSLIVFGLFAPNLSAQMRQGAVENSNARARSVLEAAKKAHGVAGTLPGMEDISFKISGWYYLRGQSLSPDQVDSRPLTGDLTIDVAKDRLYWFAETEFSGGLQLQQVVIIKGDQGTLLQPLQKTIRPLPNPLVRELLTFRVPQILLARALECVNTLRWVGEAQFAGKKQDVISFATTNGTLMTLYFDAATHLLTKTEMLGADPVFGSDAITENVISGYQRVGDFLLPSGQVQKIAGGPSQEYVYSDFRLNAHPADGRFEPPAGYVAPPPPVQLGTQQLAKDIWLVEGLGGGAYASLIVGFKDFAVVVEPTLNEATSRTVMEKVRELAPGKPIRYVIATHHHADHSGGARTYFAEGITLVTTPGNRDYFHELAQAPFALFPDALQAKPRVPVLELIEDKKGRITDGNRVLELYDIGPTVQAKEFLVVWVPQERILFGGDIFRRNADRSIAPANKTVQQVADAIERLGLPVERLVDVHSRVNTMEDLRISLELARTAGGKGK